MMAPWVPTFALVDGCSRVPRPVLRCIATAAEAVVLTIHTNSPGVGAPLGSPLQGTSSTGLEKEQCCTSVDKSTRLPDESVCRCGPCRRAIACGRYRRTCA